MLSSHKKHGIPAIATARMDFEDIMLSEISQRRTNTVWPDLYVKSEKSKLTDTENRLVVARGGGWGVGELDEGGPKVQNLQL